MRHTRPKYKHVAVVRGYTTAAEQIGEFAAEDEIKLDVVVAMPQIHREWNTAPATQAKAGRVWRKRS